MSAQCFNVKSKAFYIIHILYLFDVSEFVLFTSYKKNVIFLIFLSC